MTALDVDALARDLVARYNHARRAYGEYQPPPGPCVRVTIGEVEPVVHELPVPATVVCPLGDQVLVGLVLPMYPPLDELWIWQRYTLGLAVSEAYAELWEFVKEFGEVETPTGLWRLDGHGRLVFARTDHRPFGAAPATHSRARPGA